MKNYETDLRNKNRGYMKLIVWQKAIHALGSLAETVTRVIGLRETKQIPGRRFHDFDLLHYEVENRLLRLIEKLEQNRDDGDRMARIAEDPEEYATTPSLHYSITPSLRAHA
jgi:hypothetical protein